MSKTDLFFWSGKHPKTGTMIAKISGLTSRSKMNYDIQFNQDGSVDYSINYLPVTEFPPSVLTKRMRIAHEVMKERIQKLITIDENSDEAINIWRELKREIQDY